MNAVVYAIVALAITLGVLLAGLLVATLVEEAAAVREARRRLRILRWVLAPIDSRSLLDTDWAQRAQVLHLAEEEEYLTEAQRKQLAADADNTPTTPRAGAGQVESANLRRLRERHERDGPLIRQLYSEPMTYVAPRDRYRAFRQLLLSRLDDLPLEALAEDEDVHADTQHVLTSLPHEDRLFPTESSSATVG